MASKSPQKKQAGNKKQAQAKQQYDPLAVNPLHVLIGLIIVGAIGSGVYFGLYSLDMSVSTESESNSANFLYCIPVMSLFLFLFGVVGTLTRRMYTIFGPNTIRRAAARMPALYGSAAVVTGLSVMSAGLGILLAGVQAFPQLRELDFETVPAPGQNPIPLITAFSLVVGGYLVGHVMQAIISKPR